MTTIQDIADRLGVSKMTVSNALHGKPNVGPGMRRRILEAVRATGYHPNAAATALSTGHSGIVQIVIQDFESPFYGRLAKCLSERIERDGMRSFASQALYSARQEERLAGPDPQLFADALVLVNHTADFDQIRAMAGGRPTILVDELRDQDFFSTVNTPSETGARAATEHLLERGCRDIGIIGSDRHLEDRSGARITDRVGAMRLRGVREALAAHGLKLSSTARIPSEWTMEGGRQTARRLARQAEQSGRPFPFDGLLCMSDSVALGVIRGLAEEGIAVPNETKVIGFDGSVFGQYAVPSLSTIDIDMPAMAETIARRLRNQISRLKNDRTRTARSSSPSPITHDIAPFTLRERESTAAE